ncbi:MAG: hypothetical protein ACLQIB_44075 [Isosphaeraceae bacterium]
MSPGDDPNSADWALEQMDASEPTPADAVVRNEAIEQRLQALPDPELREIALWKLDGWTNQTERRSLPLDLAAPVMLNGF